MLRSLCAIFALLLCVQSSRAESSILELVKKNYSTANTIQAQFDLDIYWNVREKKEHKSGKLFIAPNDRFRVEAGEETMVSDGHFYWDYNRKASQVVIKNLRDLDAGMLPSGLLTTYLTKYALKEKKRDGGEAVFEWKADSASNLSTAAIAARVQTNTGVVNSLIVTDRSGNTQTYTFKKTAFGRKIPQEVFRFEAPKNARIVDNR